MYQLLSSVTAGVGWASGSLHPFFRNDTATTEIYTLSLHDALPIWERALGDDRDAVAHAGARELQRDHVVLVAALRSEEHTSELQSRPHLVCRLLLEKKKIYEQQSAETAIEWLRTEKRAQQPNLLML